MDLAVFVYVVVVAAGDVLGGGCFEAELVAFTDQAQEADLDLCASDGRAGAVHNHERKAMRPGSTSFRARRTLICGLVSGAPQAEISPARVGAPTASAPSSVRREIARARRARSRLEGSGLSTLEV